MFKVTRLSDTSWTEWSEPVNIGKEINTVADDLDLVVSTTGSLAYYVSYQGPSPSDLYCVTLPDAMQPEPFVLIYGKVQSEQDFPLDTTLWWINSSTGNTIMTIHSRAGKYSVALPPRDIYTCVTLCADYEPIMIDLLHTNMTHIEKNIQLSCTEFPVKGYPTYK